ncbi:MAG: M48 family metalloprotease [Alphaproteobacteria bacterium]|nr:M48 family metalloprotease [Alphaproteobacteria bacterium]MCB9796565.1 M48 family metalloprotease [Alphaproteobacteria bacterium]
MIAALLLLLACEPAPPPVQPSPPQAPAALPDTPGGRRPLPEVCVQRLGVLAQQLSLALDAGLRQSLRADWDDARERVLGDRLLIEVLASSGPTNPEWTERAGRVLEGLQAAWPEARFTHRAWVIDDAELNAFALPGGALLLHRGLLERTLGHEDQLAFVIAHEMAHVELGHAAALHRYMAGLPEGERAEGAELLALSRGGFSSTWELEADRLGVVLLHLAGYDPSAAEAFWSQSWPPPEGPSPLAERLLPQLRQLEHEGGQELLRQLAASAGMSLEEAAPEGLETALLPLLASHPPPEVRACVCRETAAWVQGALPREAEGSGP